MQKKKNNAPVYVVLLYTNYLAKHQLSYGFFLINTLLYLLLSLLIFTVSKNLTLFNYAVTKLLKPFYCFINVVKYNLCC